MYSLWKEQYIHFHLLKKFREINFHHIMLQKSKSVNVIMQKKKRIESRYFIVEGHTKSLFLEKYFVESIYC